MKIDAQIEVIVGDDGEIVLRQPNNEEWNTFAKTRFPMRRGGQKPVDNSGPARVKFFDLLVVEISNIEDVTGPITMETKERLPEWIKTDVIFRAFENREDVELKN